MAEFEISFGRGGYRIVSVKVDEPLPEYFEKLNTNDKFSWIMANAKELKEQAVKKDEWFPTDVVEVHD